MNTPLNSHVVTKLDDHGVAWITLNRPEVHNAFDDAVIQQLIAALEDTANDDNVRVVVLNSNGKNFSAGADLNWMRSMAAKNYNENLDDANQLARLMSTLDTHPKPTIALVQGAAFGGALGLIACCDIAIAQANASFCLSEVKIGLIPAVISPYVVRAIGERASRRYFITAERFFAEEALNLGLIHELVDLDELHTRADYYIKQLLQNSPQGIKEAKRLIAAVNNKSIDEDVIADTSARIATIRVSEEGQEGLTAFLEKRKPNWIQPDEEEEDV